MRIAMCLAQVQSFRMRLSVNTRLAMLLKRNSLHCVTISDSAAM